MTGYRNASELKALARGQLLGSYSTAVGAVVLVGGCNLALTLVFYSVVDFSSVIGTFLFYLLDFVKSLLFGLLSVGQCYMFLKLAVGQRIYTRDVFYGFKLYPEKTVRMYVFLTICADVFLLPSMLVGILPSTGGFANVVYYGLLLFGYVCVFIFRLTFSQCRYLLLDFPERDWRTLLMQSARLMRGNKLRLFALECSFIPLFLLGFLSFGVAFFWIVPYMESTLANFFLDLMKNGGGASA